MNATNLSRKATSISVVIPAFDEEASVGDVVRASLQELSSSEYDAIEVVVVDDGSQDNTESAATAAGARVIRHPYSIGYGGALKTGIRSAAHDTIIILDADGTYPVGAIPKLIEKYKNGYDMVVGMRRSANYTGGVLKGPLRYILRFLVEYTTGQKIPDANSGLRVFDRETITSYFPMLCNNFSFTTSLTLTYLMSGRFVGYIEIPYFQRVGRSKVRLFRDSLRTIQYIVELITYFNPLKIFLLITTLLLIGAIGTMIIAVYLRASVFDFLTVSLLLGALVSFCCGLFAVLVKRLLERR